MEDRPKVKFPQIDNASLIDDFTVNEDMPSQHHKDSDYVDRETKDHLKDRFTQPQLDLALWSPDDLEEEPEDIEITDSMAHRMSNIRKENIFKRIFRPMQQGSLRSSVFTIFSGAVGAGVLSIPKVFSYFGLTTAIIITILNAFFAYTSYNALFQSIIMVKKKRFSNLVNTILGRRPAQIFALTIIFAQFLNVTIFVCITWNLVQHILVSYNLVSLSTNKNTNEINPYSSEAFSLRLIGLSIMLVVIMPIALMRKLNAMRYLSLLNLLILVYTVGLIIIECTGFLKQWHGDSHISSKEKAKYQIEYGSQGVNMNWFSGLSTIILSYMCHPNFVYVRSEMMAPTKRRVKKSIAYALIIESCIYALMGTAGYLSTGDHLTPDLFILRKPLEGSKDYMMKISIFLFLYVGLIHIVLNLYPCRQQAYAFFEINSDRYMNHFGLTFLIMVMSHLIVLGYPNILSLFGIAGAIFCSVIGWVIPYLMQIVLLKHRPWYSCPRLGYFMGFFFMIFLALIGSVQSVFEFDVVLIPIGKA